MVPSDCADLVKASLSLQGWVKPGPELDALCQSIAGTIITYILANATVTPNALIAPGGSGGPVTGTGKVT